MEFNEIYENEFPRLSFAIASGNVTAFNKLIKLRKGLNSKDNRGRIPLHEAAEFGRENFAIALLKYSKDIVNCRSHEGETPLFLACKFHDNVSMVRVLVMAGADVNIGNNEGITPLHIACGRRHCRVAVKLLDVGADVNATDMNEFTPLHTAVENGVNLVTSLVSFCADPSLQDIYGRTPLFLAAQYAGVAVIKSLLEARVEVDKPAYDGVTPLMMAAQRGILEHVDLLLESGANPNIEANDNLMAIHLALGGNDHEAVVKRLLEVTDKTIISVNIKKIPDYALEFLALEKSNVSYLSLLLDSKQKPETIFQPIRITDYLCDGEEFSFQCCDSVMNVKFTAVSFLAYFLYKFHTSQSFNEILERVLECGCPVAIEDKNCFPPVLAAVHLPSTETALKCIRIFAGCGVDLDYSSNGTACPDVLISALKHSDAKVILYVLKMTSFATLEDIVYLVIRGLCRVSKVIPLMELLGGISPSVFRSASATDSSAHIPLKFTSSICSLQTLCRTSLRKQFFKKYRNHHITDICRRLQIPKLLASYLKYEDCVFPTV